MYTMKRSIYWVLLNNLKKKYYFKFELKKKLLLLLLLNNELINKFKQFLICNISYLYIQSSVNKLRNCCLVTGRSYAVNKKLMVSRFILRDYINKGFIFGYSRFSW